jgi:hypothetical protein
MVERAGFGAWAASPAHSACRVGLARPVGGDVAGEYFSVEGWQLTVDVDEFDELAARTAVACWRSLEGQLSKEIQTTTEWGLPSMEKCLILAGGFSPNILLRDQKKYGEADAR